MKLLSLLAVLFTCAQFTSLLVAAEQKPASATSKPDAATPAKPASAEAEKTEATEADKPTAKNGGKATASRPLPYQATVYRVSEKQNKFTTRTKAGKVHTFHITEKTVFLKDDKPATLADLKAGEIVRGSRYKKDDNEWEAIKVIIGAKKAAADSEE